MIRLPEFEYLAPSSLDEAVRMSAETASATSLLAGGTDLMVALKNRTAVPKRVLWLGNLAELSGIRFENVESLSIGALTTLETVANHPDIALRFPGLAVAAAAVASPAIRTQATLGGNLCVDSRCIYVNQSEYWRDSIGHCMKTHDDCKICHALPGAASCGAIFASDLAPALIAYSASVEIACNRGLRIIPLSQLYRNDGINSLILEPGEIITRIIIPPPKPGTKVVFRKLRRRRSIDFAVVNTAVSVTHDSVGCTGIRIVVGAVASAPMVFDNPPAVSFGKPLTFGDCKAAASEVANQLKPIPNVHESVGYRKRMAGVLIQEALCEAAGIDKSAVL